MIGLLRALCRLLYRFRAYGTESLKTPGPVLLLPNHVSWFDWLFLGACLDEDWKFVTSRFTAQASPVHRFIMINRRTFPIDPLSPYGVKRMAEFLQKGGRLVLFPEGRISRTGTLMKLFDGTGFLLHKTGAKVITCYLRGAHRLPYSRNSDQKIVFPKVTAHFSEVLQPPHLEKVGTAEARQALTDWLRDQMIRQQFRTEMEFGPGTVPQAILEAGRRRPGHEALQDLYGSLSYRRLVQSTTLLTRQWQRLLPPPAATEPGAASARRAAGGEDGPPGNGASRKAEPRVGVLLPNTNAMPLTLFSLWCCDRVPAILNYTSGPSLMKTCVELAGLRQIITSRAFLGRAKIDLAPLTASGVQCIYLEDVRKRIGRREKLGLVLGWIRLPRPRRRPEDTAVILFTSGSEGVPKGVELTHANLLANVRQMLAVCDLGDADRFFNALPIFHSFGLAAGLLLPLVRGAYVCLYPSPLHYRIVPTVAYERDCTVLLATNTFLNGYARRAGPYDFRALRYLFAGAEKVQHATAIQWGQRFGVRVLEGYGATECSPVISVNTPLMPKYGTAGHLLPDMEARLEPVDGVAEGGRLFVRGPNVMRGYLNPEADAAFQAMGGWYDTGDIARLDGEGFITILGRQKRFAKISGEMVSLTAVEDALAGAFPDLGPRCQVAVIARPSEEKGEELVAVTNEPSLTLDRVRTAIRTKGMSNLCQPRELMVVREIPKLGTGKVDHRELVRTLYG